MSNTILLIFGGNSPEHEVSIKSAKTIYLSLKKKNYEVILLGISKSGQFKFIEDEKLENLIDILDNCGKNCFIVKNNIYIEKSSSTSLVAENNIINNDNYLIKSFNKAFPIIHGTTGEDGVIQGWLEFLGINYAGSNAKASNLAMDKDLMSYVLKDLVEKVPYLVLYQDTPAPTFENALSNLNNQNPDSRTKYLIVKPNDQGSSIGVSKVSNETEFQNAIKTAFNFSDKVLIEQCLNCNEIEIAIIGPRDKPESSVNIAELEMKSGFAFYDYDAKYINDGANFYIPARITQNQADYIREVSKKVYTRIGCDGFARIDFLLCKQTNKIYFNEVNTLPGFTSISMFPRLFMEDGMKIEDLVEKIINS